MYKLNTDRVLLSYVIDDGVLFDFKKNEYMSLNETLTQIVSGVREGKNADEISRELSLMYNISEEACLPKVERALADLLEKKYIVTEQA